MRIFQLFICSLNVVRLIKLKLAIQIDYKFDSINRLVIEKIMVMQRCTFPSFWCSSNAAINSVAQLTRSELGENSSWTTLIWFGWMTCFPSEEKSHRHGEISQLIHVINTYITNNYNDKKMA